MFFWSIIRPEYLSFVPCLVFVLLVFVVSLSLVFVCLFGHTILFLGYGKGLTEKIEYIKEFFRCS
jgi:hypothetical protein